MTLSDEIETLSCRIEAMLQEERHLGKRAQAAVSDLNAVMRERGLLERQLEALKRRLAEEAAARRDARDARRTGVLAGG